MRDLLESEQHVPRRDRRDVDLAVAVRLRDLQGEQQRVQDQVRLQGTKIYTLGRPLSRDVLLTIFDMIYRPLGRYCSHCTAQFVTGTSVREHNKTLRVSGRPRVYLARHLIYEKGKNLTPSPIFLAVRHRGTKHRAGSPYHYSRLIW